MGIIKKNTNIKPGVVQRGLACLHNLQMMGFLCCAVGGAARDTFLGVPPRDFDIEVYGFKNVTMETYDPDAVSDLLEAAIEYYFGEESYQYVRCYNKERGSSDRMHGAILLKDKSYGVDFIIYRDCKSMQDVVNCMDFNLNQFGFCDVAEDLPNEPVYLGTTDLRHLTPVRADFSEKRNQYIVLKHVGLYEQIKRAYSEGRLV